MKEKLPQILTVIGLLMYPISREIYKRLQTAETDPNWILIAGFALTAVFIATAFSLQFKKMLKKRADVHSQHNGKV